MPDLEALVPAARAHRSENSRKRLFMIINVTFSTSSCVSGGSAALQGPEGPVSRQDPLKSRKRIIW